MATCDRCSRSAATDDAQLVNGSYGYSDLCRACEEYLATPASEDDPRDWI